MLGLQAAFLRLLAVITACVQDAPMHDMYRLHYSETHLIVPLLPDCGTCALNGVV